MEGEIYFNRLLNELCEAKEEVGKLYERLRQDEDKLFALERELKEAKQTNVAMASLGVKEKLVFAMASGNKIDAINLVREQFNVDLSVARLVVEYTKGLGLTYMFGAAPVEITYRRMEANAKRAQAWVDTQDKWDYDALVNAVAYTLED